MSPVEQRAAEVQRAVFALLVLVRQAMTTATTNQPK